MPIDSEALTLCQAAREFPGRPGKDTVLRWIIRGVLVGRGPKAYRVRLGALKSGGRWYLTHEAIARFRAESTPRPGPDPPARSRPPAPPHLTKGHKLAMDRLRAQGLV